MSDVISRSGVSAWLANMGYRGLANKVMDEDRFPPVQPKSYREGYQAGFKDAQSERKRGKWIPVTNGRGGHECSLCHTYAPSFQTGDEWLTDYCPTCGACMQEVKDDA